MEQAKCSCGKAHALSTQEIVVNKEAFFHFINMLESENKKVVLLTDSLGEQLIDKAQIKFPILNLCSFSPTTSFAESLPDKGQDIVAALGKEELISVAKYYAFKFSSSLYICPLENFTDWTFSSFARLYDGIDIGFFKAAEPQKIYVCPANNPSPLQAYYLSTKFLVAFDNLVGKMVYEKNDCPKMEEYFNNTLKELSLNNSPEENARRVVWSLIRLGQGMTYFDQTKYFLGAERSITDLLMTIRENTDFLEMVGVASKLIINAYSCFFSGNPAYADINLSRQVNKLAELLKVPPSVIISRLSDSKLLFLEPELKQRYLGYRPYLMRALTKLSSKAFALQARLNISIDPLKKAKYTLAEIEKCFALSPLISSRPTGLGLIGSFGYLDKLL